LIETLHAENVRLAPHEHEDPSIVIAIEGGWSERVETRVFECRPGSFLLKPAGTRHGNVYSTEPTRSVLLQFTVTRAAQWEPSRRAFRNCLYFESPGIAMRLLALLRDPDEHSILELEENASSVLSLIVNDTVQRRRKKIHLRRLKAARDELLDWGRVTRSLTDVAMRCGLTPSTFTHAFRAEFGCAPSVLLRRHRLEKAVELLRNSRESLSSIAQSAGFADQAHLCREFRRILRTSPGEFRRASIG
jgi:AraC-like DNA-binding protein